MKTLISILFAIACLALPLQAQSPYASCITGGPGTCLSAGGVVAVITVYTNTGSGQSTVLPVRVKMFDDVMGTPQWWAITNGVFGSNVTVLPFQDVSAPQGYMLYWTEHHNPYGYPMTYSSVYPIIIESSSGGTWSNEFYFCLYGISTAVAGCGPCEVSSGESKGIVEAFLYDGSNTNGLDNTIAGTTNSIMGRFGLGACDTRYVDSGSRASVAFVYFNLPPHPATGPGVYCKPIANILNQPFADQWCGYDTNYVPGFIACEPNADNPQNWRYPDSSCDSNPLKQFRVRFDGSPCCDSQACASAPTLMAAVSGGSMNLSFNMQTGIAYRVFYNNDLNNSNWSFLTPWLRGTGTIEISDDMIDPRRFYRLGYRTN